MLQLNMAILKLKEHNEAKEIEFEIECFSKLSTQQLFEMMIEKSKFIMEILKQNGHTPPIEIIKRP